MKFKSLFLAAALMACIGFASTPSYAVDTPETVAGVKTVTAEELQKLQAAGAVIVDARIASEYADAHIPGAVSIPYREVSAKAVDFDSKVDSFDVSKFPADKAKAIVTYCNGIYCWKSPKAALLAVRAGHTNVHWYRVGLDDWKAKKLPTE